ncbi:uncharacterized protein LOC135204583 [Macrobrachium nipponense]|uniref:uncharacterized protein LOC135204583 n=1 Tax=Macrobrachium nipponense TaxID=159736 RepID=UPI0030C8387F
MLPIVVIKGNRASLLGRNWLNEMKMDWPNIFNLKSTIHSIDNGSDEIANILKKYESVFETRLGCLKDFEVSLKVKSDAVPVSKHARSVPYHLRETVERELQRLRDIGVIKSVDFSEWASPTVNIVKSDGKVVMENVQKDIPNVAVYLDDIVITGPTEDIVITSPTEDDHLKKLELVLHKLCSSGLKLKKDKCSFMNKEVQHLGHKLDAEGVPTYMFLMKRSLFLTCDASSFGLGAVLEQESEDGSLKPVSYASRTLTRSEKNYGQTEKEGLSVIWAVNKFHKYLYGRKFEIWTDHKPLLGLLGEGKAVHTPHIASGRIIRWSLVLSGYDYKLKYKPRCKIPNADCLSRFPMQINEFEPANAGEEVLLLEHVDTTNVNSSDIRRWTDRDPVLSQVRSCILNGWDNNFELNEDYKPYVSRKNELTLLQGCILWGNRIIVPLQGRYKVTDELHDTHPAFVGEEFQSFVTKNGIHHVTSAPYHPSTNGLTENAVKTFKTTWKKM